MGDRRAGIPYVGTPPQHERKYWCEDLFPIDVCNAPRLLTWPFTLTLHWAFPSRLPPGRELDYSKSFEGNMRVIKEQAHRSGANRILPARRKVNRLCTKRHRTLVDTEFSSIMGLGNIVYSESPPGDWASITPQSLAQKLWKFACGKH